MTQSYLKRVQAGAAWLDQVNSGWILLMNLDTLCIDCEENCVLAQVFGNYHDGAEVVSSHGKEVCDLGFDVGGEEDADKAYYWLQRRWAAEIKQRQQALAVEVEG